ncbi:Transcription initiation factor TFIIE beta subunit [Zalerion maritima]|uniref:Transcription initiation factor IIE subunit beta n=1 Tax=Zalerion maritima TaxID=339359 RepID=A0AAD5RP93_9PEZI|nr:Transcription initiation factor TFIIE beta subunit [Zalerion maritima]
MSTNKPSKKFGGKGMLAQQAAMIGKVPAKPSAESLLQPNPPSPAGSIASMTSRDGPPSASKRKRGEAGTPRTPLFNQTPAETGHSMLALMGGAVDFLKSKKGEPQTVEQITNYLSMRDEDKIKELVQGMRAHRGIHHAEPEASDPGLVAGMEEWRLGTYAYRAKIPGVKDKLSLLEYLRKRTEAIGVSVKDIKDGWPDCDKAILELEKEHQLLVVRTKKDNHARLVWLDVKSLHHKVEAEVAAQWYNIQLPSVDDMPRELLKEGQKPSSHEPRGNKPMFNKQQKKKAARKTAKLTNTHMADLFQDYSHMGRRAV